LHFHSITSLQKNLSLFGNLQMALSFLDSPSSPPTPFADQLPPLDRHYLPSNANMEWDQDMLDELLDSSLDLDEFLATVVVQAPLQSGICELTPEEVSAFIIPPPPPPSTYNVLVSLDLIDYFSLFGVSLFSLWAWAILATILGKPQLFRTTEPQRQPLSKEQPGLQK
jgi:hypothetical protein